MQMNAFTLLLLHITTPISYLHLRICYATSDETKEQKKHQHQQDELSKNSLIVAGYLPDYRFYIDLKATSLFLTDLILFSIAPNKDGSIINTCCLDKHHYEKAREVREYKRKYILTRKMSPVDIEGKDNTDSTKDGAILGSQLRLLVTVGGAGRSDAFHKIANDKGLQKIFIQELKELCLKEKLDGIDYNWESPSNQIEMDYYTKLIEETYTVLHPMGLLVTVALHPNQYLSSYEYVDRVHVMAYDMPRALQFHARSDVVFKVLQSFATTGKCPKSKIVSGIPAYARHEVNPALVKTYSEIIDAKQQKAQSSSSKLVKDLNTFSNMDGYLFDSPASVEKKVSFVKNHKMAGIFFWEIGQDKQMIEYPGGVLLQSAARAASSDFGDGKSNSSSSRDEL